VLRVENTDSERSSKEFEKRIIGDLKWMLVDWDEGPYYQIDRLDIYTKYLTKLIESGKVYPCYCTDEELETERSMLIARRQIPRYMGKCRNLSEEERRKLEEEGRKPAYRFRVEKGTVEFEDLIRGKIKVDCDSIGDFIIVRSNGIPAYNFAVVIDDHLMEISHVVRGEDHISNTPLQILLYKTLGFEPPTFAHHSLILGSDHAKLSKRHGSVSVREFRDKGILPEALVNYLSLLGSSFEGGAEICSIDEIIKGFSIDRAGKSSAVFDEKKLRWLNGIYIRNYDIERLIELLVPFANKAGYDLGQFEKDKLHLMIEAVRGNLSALSEIGDYIDIFFDDGFELSDDAASILKKEGAMKVVDLLYDILLSLGGHEGEGIYGIVMSGIKKKTDLKGRKLFMPMRAALTGKTWGPELDRLFSIIGIESALKRIEKVKNIIGAG
jgi:glutamyl-tRNA synthetase